MRFGAKFWLNHRQPAHTLGIFSVARLALTLLAVALPAGAQTEKPTALTPGTTPTLKIQSNLVAVSAIVRDATGKPVSGLTRADFLLKQDGKSQSITYFSQGSQLPLTLALMVDTSGSQRNYITDEVVAGRAFFPAMLTKPDDRAVLVQFDNVILQLVPLTDSVITLEHGLAYLSQSHSDYRSRAEADQLANLRDHMNFPARFGGTHLFDAICAVSKIELGNQMGRRAMVILTDGGDNGSQFNLKDAIRAAQGADIMIYSVYYSNGGGNLDVLQDLSKATGGRVFTVSPTSSLQQIYADIAADLRLEYQIGYAPPDLRPNRYHKIDLRTADNTLIVQAREGYFTPK